MDVCEEVLHNSGLPPEVLVSLRQILQVMFKDVWYDDGLNRDGTGQISCNTVLCNLWHSWKKPHLS